MPVDLKKLKELIKRKGGYIARQQEELEKLLLQLGQQFANDFALLVGRGVFDVTTMALALDALGYTNQVINRISNFQPLLDFAAEISAAQGIRFLLTEQQQAQLMSFVEVAETALQTKFRQEIAEDMARFAIESRLAQTPFEQIKLAAAERIEVYGRRAAVEVGTAISVFDRSVMSGIYENAGIDRFVYFPPTLIETSRDSCRRAVGDPRQKTGWTRTEIAEDPELDFVLGGKPYFNCRHQWIAFSAEVAA